MYKVHITFHRVQRWLFSVPRLRAMIGANILLGELLRDDLKTLALDSSKSWTLSPCTLSQTHVSQALQDPLGEDEDNPYTDARAGILSRDGGHFIAQFTDTQGSQSFANAAQALIHTKCPALEYHITLDDLICVPNPACESSISKNLPVFAPCQWSGNGIASSPIFQGQDQLETSLETKQRWDMVVRPKTRDLASLVLAKSKLAATSQLEELKSLANGGYLAVIHADGNGVGSASECISDEHGKICFFHRIRILLRSALLSAIDRACPADTSTKRPLQILMLGGDDLLVVCQAHLALDFIIYLCTALRELQLQPSSNQLPDFRLTLGIGAVITRPTIPFNRLHELAEMLASSAKRKFRKTETSNDTSLVDWSIYTTALIEQIHVARQRDWVFPGDPIRILSHRPIAVLGDGFDSLEGLVSKAKELEAANIPRSQLRFLLDQLKKGQHLSELAFAELAPTAKNALHNLGLSKLWSRSGRHLTTSLLDLIETYEIPKLGSKTRKAANAISASPMLQNKIAHA